MGEPPAVPVDVQPFCIASFVPLSGGGGTLTKVVVDAQHSTLRRSGSPALPGHGQGGGSLTAAPASEQISANGRSNPANKIEDFIGHLCGI
jgi:hypothetical protein